MPGKIIYFSAKDAIVQKNISLKVVLFIMASGMAIIDKDSVNRLGKMEHPTMENGVRTKPLETVYLHLTMVTFTKVNG